TARGQAWLEATGARSGEYPPARRAPALRRGASSAYPPVRRKPGRAGCAGGYARSQSSRETPAVTKGFFFVLRLAAAWFLAVLLVSIMWSELPLLGRLEWPIALLGMATMALVITGA